jgi:hypothetical protein
MSSVQVVVVSSEQRGDLVLHVVRHLTLLALRVRTQCTLGLRVPRIEGVELDGMCALLVGLHFVQECLHSPELVTHAGL